MRLLHRSPRTSKAYRHWIRRYLVFHEWRHPAAMGAREVTAFLSDLATRCDVAASTQNQALAALLFLYRELLEVDLPWLDDLVRARRPRRVPTVLSLRETRALLEHAEGTAGLMLRLLYGSGLRLLECARLRIKDVDLDRRTLTVHDGKGKKGRPALIPEALVKELRRQLAEVEALHESDLRAGAGWVELRAWRVRVALRTSSGVEGAVGQGRRVLERLGVNVKAAWIAYPQGSSLVRYDSVGPATERVAEHTSAASGPA